MISTFDNILYYAQLHMDTTSFMIAALLGGSEMENLQSDLALIGYHKTLVRILKIILLEFKFFELEITPFQKASLQ